MLQHFVKLSSANALLLVVICYSVNVQSKWQWRQPMSLSYPSSDFEFQTAWSEVCFPVRTSFFLFSKLSIPALWYTQTPIYCVPDFFFFLGVSGRGVDFTTYLPLASRLRMSVVMPLFSVYALISWKVKHCLLPIKRRIIWCPVRTGPARQHLHTVCIHGHHTDWLLDNCSNVLILAHFIVNSTILMF